MKNTCYEIFSRYSKTVLLSSAALLTVITPALANQSNKGKTRTLDSDTLPYATKTTEVKFAAGKTTLSKSDKNNLTDAVTSARNKGQIEKVKAFIWADREYPVQEAQNERASESSIKLANERGEAVKEYLKSINAPDVELFNMAESPNALQEYLKTDEYREKSAVMNDTSTGRNDIGLFGKKGRASTALVMVYLEDNK